MCVSCDRLRLRMGSHEEVPMAIYCGIDFHPRQQSVSYCDAAGGAARFITRSFITNGMTLPASTLSSLARSSLGWRPVATAPGSSNCSPASATGCGSATRPRSAAGPSGGRRTTAVTPNSSLTCCCGASSRGYTARRRRAGRYYGCCATATASSGCGRRSRTACGRWP